MEVMRILLYLLLAGAMMYGAWRFTPDDARQQGLAMVATFDEAAFDGLRERLRLRLPGLENPADRREELLEAVGERLETVGRELENISTPASTRAAPLGRTKPERGLSEIGKIQGLLEETQGLLNELGELNPKSGVLQEASRRILGKVLPASPPAEEPGASCQCPAR